jgi:DUF2075 family protein
MELYKGDAASFIEEATRNKIASDLTEAYFNYFGFMPEQNEQRSWRNSLRALKDVFADAGLSNQGVSLEYLLPFCSRRLDCMVTGRDEANAPEALIIELKQWESTKPCVDENEVLTYLNGEETQVPHPSVQVGEYKRYLKNFVEVFYSKDPINLDSCVYLHNYEFEKNDPILDKKKFANPLSDSPLYGQNDFSKLSDFVSRRVSHGEGVTILQKIDASKKRPSVKLMDAAYDTIHANPTFILLDDQMVVYDHVKALVLQGVADKTKKHVIIVHGGPGTGKSVIAVNLCGELNREHKWANYVTSSKAFATCLRKSVGKDAGQLVTYTNGYVHQADELDCLIVDEAHRLRERAPASGSFYHSADYSGKLQIEEIFDACRVAVFFIDDDQVVKPGEVGTSSYIRQHAEERGYEVWERTLEIQFRCGGDNAYLKWLENTLDIRRTANPILEKTDAFDFRIFSSPEEMENLLKEKIAEGFTARLVSGFVFKWSNAKVQSKDQLPCDVVIGDWKRPWNLRKPVEGLPDNSLWANKPSGFGQVGCVYSAQGLEFDYVGVIFGNDIVYSFDKGEWIAMPMNNCDSNLKTLRDNPAEYLRLVKNVYRVLMSRGLKGCYVYFMDKETEKFVKSRIGK